MKVYKILHKPTGLYFTPSQGSGNLSTTGKIYSRKPSLTVCIGGSIRIIVHEWKDKKLSKKLQTIVNFFEIPKPENETYWIDKHFSTPYEDWEIVEL
jgi:hypothetical protein